ncbi:MAG: MotA/TolQ/ExbB proton channel family protein [candidate division WOR-3 bacterium]|nr:MotA/TolQ/ExbB proton channel family protein [candidate division WOR-3 bacterium]
MEPLTLPASNNFISILLGLGIFAKIIVLILIFFSIISWAIIIKKYFQFRSLKKQNRFFYEIFEKHNSIFEILRFAEEYPNNLVAKLVITANEEYRKITQNNPVNSVATADKETLSLKLLPNVDSALTRTIAVEAEQLEKNLTFLATCGSVSPFLGLLGTVWGILSAFLNVRHIPVVTLQIIAPGISDALVTTVAGLLVAIPAVIAYNYYVGQVKSFVNEMENWALEIVADIRKQILL